MFAILIRQGKTQVVSPFGPTGDKRHQATFFVRVQKLKKNIKSLKYATWSVNEI